MWEPAYHNVNTKNIKMKSFRNKSDKLLREIKLIQFYIGCYANPNPKVEGTIEYHIPVLACTAVQQRNMRGLFLCSYAVVFFSSAFFSAGRALDQDPF